MSFLPSHPTDKPMHLNDGKFKQNGRCGYVLMPDCMFNPGFNPMDVSTHTNSRPITLSIQVCRLILVSMLSSPYILLLMNTRTFATIYRLLFSSLHFSFFPLPILPILPPQHTHTHSGEAVPELLRPRGADHHHQLRGRRSGPTSRGHHTHL